MPSSALSELLKWVHVEAAEPELVGIESEYRYRQRICWLPSPLQVLQDGQRVAAAYFSCLPGELAMLGGVRAIRGAEGLAVQLLREQIRTIVQRIDQPQIQAAIADSDPLTQKLALAAGFDPLTAVDQLWISLVDNHIIQPADQTPPTQRSDLRWSTASELSLKRFVRLIGATFDQTLDCPELNGVRSNRQAVQSFLMKRPLRSCPHWFILWHRDQIAGCLLLQAHHTELVELVYMGLVPQARGKRLGKFIIEQAKNIARQLGATMMVLAADIRNTPAITTYRQTGFQFHRRLQVYWYRS